MTHYLQYFADNVAAIGLRTAEHCAIVGMALLLAVPLGIVLGIALARPSMRAVRGPAFYLLGLGQTVPSLALLALAVGVLGVGFVPAVLAILAYSILPIARNTFTGLRSVPAPTIDAALGLGMTSPQILRRVELPLAAPFVIAGLRTAAVVAVSAGALASLVGAGGLGDFIFTGINLFKPEAMLAGAIPIALLALLADWGLGRLERRLAGSHRTNAPNNDAPSNDAPSNGTQRAGGARLRVLALLGAPLLGPLLLGPLLLASLLLSSCSRDDTVVVGAKAFTEGYILGHMASLVLQDAGYDVEEQFGLATTAMRGALETGQVDLYYEYTGTAYTVYAKGADTAVMPDSARVLAAVRAFDSAEHGLVWLQPMAFDDTYALLMKSERAGTLGIGSIGDLARKVREGTSISIGVDAEFYERPDGLKALAARYGFPERDVIKLDAGLVYGALIEGKIDVGMGYSTDGQIAAFNLVALDDDARFFPAYNPAAVVRAELLRRKPGVRTALERLNRFVDAKTIRSLNAEVAMSHRDPRKVAERWLLEKGLIRRP